MAHSKFCHPLIVVMLASLAGCSSTIRWPRLRGPGPASYQRANADAFDPYPLPDLGPPIVGGRPREFSIPRNEVERAQDYAIVSGMKAQPALPPAPIPVGPPMPMSPPPAATTPILPAAPATPLPTSPSIGPPSIRYYRPLRGQ